MRSYTCHMSLAIQSTARSRATALLAGYAQIMRLLLPHISSKSYHSQKRKSRKGEENLPLFFQSVKEPTNRQNATYHKRASSRAEAKPKSRDLRTPKDEKFLASQGILTYCATRPSRVSSYTSGSSCLSWWPL